MAVSVDFNTNMRNSIRFKKDIENNVNKQKFYIGKVTVVQGLVLVVTKNILTNQKPVSMYLSKIDEDDIGSITIGFRNACFNSLGFLTHDTAEYVE